MITSYLTKNFYINTIIVILIFILDRFSKIYVMNLDKVNYPSELYQSKYLNISLVWNEGIAFGLLSFNQDNLYNLLKIDNFSELPTDKKKYIDDSKKRRLKEQKLRTHDLEKIENTRIRPYNMSFSKIIKNIQSMWFRY